MAAILFGATGLIYQPGEKVKISKNGLLSATTIAMCRASEANALFPALGSAHRNISGLYLADVEFIREEGDLAVFAMLFEGLGDSGPYGSLPDPVYTLIQSMSQEPIDSNPRFVSHIGGTPTAPLNKAVFNEDNTFKGFEAVISGAPNPKAGITDYLSATMVWRKNWVSAVRPSNISDSGKIGVPEGDPPDLGGDRNWLVGPYQIVDRGGGQAFENTLDWLASGPGGWDPDIYVEA